MPDYAHLKLHDQFVALTDMKLHAPNQLYTSICFWDKILKASMGLPGHDFNWYETTCTKSTLYVFLFLRS